MCTADVTSSQRSPGFGSTRRLLKTAFSSVLRDLSSSVIRDAGTPSCSNSFTAKKDSGGSLWNRLGLPPVKTSFAAG